MNIFTNVYELPLTLSWTATYKQEQHITPSGLYSQDMSQVHVVCTQCMSFKAGRGQLP